MHPVAPAHCASLAGTIGGTWWNVARAATEAAPQLYEAMRRAREPAADHDATRIHQREKRQQRISQRRRRAFDDDNCALVSRIKRREQIARGSFAARRMPCAAKRRSANDRFEAAVLPACTQSAVLFDDDMAQFSANAVGTGRNVAADDVAAGDAGAERQGEDVVKSLTSAPPRFGEGGGATVVHNTNLCAESAAECGPQRQTIQSRNVHRAQHRAARLVNETRNRNGHPQEVRSCRNLARDGFEFDERISLRRRHRALAQHNRPVGSDHFSQLVFDA